MGEEIIEQADSGVDSDGSSSSSGGGSGSERNSTISTSSTTGNSQVKDRDGCEHYRRKARLVAPCCSNVYACRFCHDAAEGHAVDRHSVEEMVCNYCDTRQPVQQDCEHCGTRLGKYYCSKCRLHDDEEKGQFHCVDCGICRSGGRDNYFHCPNCDLCLPMKLQNNHKCVNGVGHSDCGVCLEDIQSSRAGSQVLPCGHLLHVACFREMLKHHISVCPKCKHSAKNRAREWARMDHAIRRSVVPAEYRHTFMEALCNDCHATTRVKYHIVGLKCASCGSYNTVPAGPLEREEQKSAIESIVSGLRRLGLRMRPLMTSRRHAGQGAAGSAEHIQIPTAPEVTAQ